MLTDLFEPPDRAATPEPYPLSCPDQAADETRPEYAARCLRYLLAGGPLSALTREQLAQADTAAQTQVCRLPLVLEPHDQTQDRTLNDIRHRLAQEQRRRSATAAQAAAILEACYPPTSDLDDAPGPQDAPQTAEQRAVRLLKAALILIMDDERPRGGRGARLIPPSPTRPPGSVANVPGGF